jgi:hypothetical protein
VVDNAANKQTDDSMAMAVLSALEMTHAELARRAAIYVNLCQDKGNSVREGEFFYFLEGRSCSPVSSYTIFTSHVVSIFFEKRLVFH